MNFYIKKEVINPSSLLNWAIAKALRTIYFNIYWFPIMCSILWEKPIHIFLLLLYKVGINSFNNMKKNVIKSSLNTTLLCLYIYRPIEQFLILYLQSISTCTFYKTYSKIMLQLNNCLPFPKQVSVRHLLSRINFTYIGGGAD